MLKESESIVLNCLIKKKMRLKRKTNSEKKEKRANTVLTEEQKEANRAKECKRKQRYREKKKGLKLSNAILKNKYTKGMAMKKVSKTLSKTPAKKIEVIRTLATSLSQRQR